MQLKENSNFHMIPVGYMYNKAQPREERHPNTVIDVYSVGECGSGLSAQPFVENYIRFWKHNGYWFFDSPEVMKEIADEEGIDVADFTLFYYEAYELEFDMTENADGSSSGKWSPFLIDDSFTTEIKPSKEKLFAGYGVVEFVTRNSPEDSLLACCPSISSSVEVNTHCLFDQFEDAKIALEKGVFHDVEPGPYRIFAVYLVKF